MVRRCIELLGVPICIASLLLPARFCHAELPFQGASLAYEVGQFPTAAVFEDFNRDGHLDLAVGNIRDTVSLLFGVGDGTFRGGADVPAGRFPSALAAADFNEDGVADLAVADQGPGQVLFGRPEGGFEPPQPLAMGAGTLSCAVSDFNLDGHADLAFGDPYMRDIAIRLGNGDGTFSPATRYGEAIYAMDLAAGDVNGDGYVDIVAVDYFRNAVFQWLGNGDGTFQSETFLPTGNSPRSVALGDINGDGRLDAAASSSDSRSRTVALFLGTPMGLGAAGEVEVGIGPYKVALADLTQDGDVDLLAVLGDGGAHVLAGDGAGQFAPLSVTYAAGIFPGHSAIADVNHDGRPDLAVPSGERFVSVLLGNGHGFGGSIELPGVTDPFGLVIGDVTADGIRDIVVGSYAGKLLLHPGRTTGGFSAPVLLQSKPGVLDLKLSDVTHDGVQDILAARFGSVAVYEGSASDPGARRHDYELAGYIPKIALGDFNNDKWTDVLALLPTRGLVAVLPGRPNGVFGSPIYSALADSSTNACTVGDFDEDGILDLAIAGYRSPVTLLRGRGDGRFAVYSEELIEDAEFVMMTTDDFDGDGHLDLACSVALLRQVGGGGIETGSVVYLLRGDGNGDFATPMGVGGSVAYSGNVISGDFDGDGLPDLALGSTGSALVEIILNRGNGAFDPPTYIGTGRWPETVAASDLDSDGRLELVTANGLPETISIHINRMGTGAPAAARAFVRGERTVPLRQARGALRVFIEPLAGTFGVADIDPYTLRMVSSGTGSVESIPARMDKVTVFGDADANGVMDVTAIFDAAAMDHLFDGLSGKQDVTVSIEGDLSAGGRFVTPLSLTILAQRRDLAVSVSPNPIAGTGILSFRTESHGPVRVRLFDVQGRLVRTLIDTESAAPRAYDLRLDARDLVPTGSPSGVYFYLVQAAGRETRGRVAIVR